MNTLSPGPHYSILFPSFSRLTLRLFFSLRLPCGFPFGLSHMHAHTYTHAHTDSIYKQKCTTHVFFFVKTDSHCSPDRPRTHYVIQADVKIMPIFLLCPSNGWNSSCEPPLAYLLSTVVFSNHLRNCLDQVDRWSCL